MGDITGFLKYDRKDFSKDSVETRKRHWREFFHPFSDRDLSQQAARCMDCGTPFCHWGCPLANLIPDWNDLVYRGCWKEAYERLVETNNFPEMTGRICPAPCENSCVLSITKDAVTIRNVELLIIEKAFEEGWVKPRPPLKRTGKLVAIVGSGPAGLACADQLNKAGHRVTVFEKNENIGGILSLGIPDFKLEKKIIERRISVLRDEGIVFKTRCHIGVDISIHYVQKEFDAIVLAGGSQEARDLKIPGRELKGVCQAMDYLCQQNRINGGVLINPKEQINAKDKSVIILGGGDTGADCIGTANRQGAKSVKQFEILPCPSLTRTTDNPWPEWALIYRKGSSHEEGVAQDYCILTKSLSGEKGNLKKLHGIRLEYGPKDPMTSRSLMKEISDSEFEVDCDLLILAMGFIGSLKKGLVEDLNIPLDSRGNVKTDVNYMTSVNGVFSAGDMRRGQSLIVWAIHEGRGAAECVDRYLRK
ncbi:MAG: glutamate synthase subunit beta [Candidatus Omnitrophica bacterium]|nr:glutamate synthase subunit beta [Candidatus Omnitrophota bacterium]